MGTLQEIRAGILSTLRTADPDAFVQDYEEWSIDDEPESILALFKTIFHQEKRAWVFKPVGIRESTNTKSCNQVTYSFQFRMIDEIGEGRTTGETWGIIETVRQAFRDDPTLGGSCFSTKISVGSGASDSGLQVDRVDFVKIENRKVQFGEFTLSANDLLVG